MKRKQWLAAIICGLFWMLFAPQALALDDAQEARIHDGLLSTMPGEFYKNCEFFAEGHSVLETQEKDGVLEIYLAASVSGYGFMGGGFVNQAGWIGACTIILEEQAGVWTLRDVLRVDAYADIPKIMPESASQKYFASKGDEERWEQIADQLHAQAQAYLDSIGRTEPILTYSELDGELSGMLVCASNLRIAVDEDYPSCVTTSEQLEDGVRYLYTREWMPDEDGVTDPTYRSINGILEMPGTTGTETLTRTRKDDGKIMEKIVIRVELFELTITMADDFGSVVYTFPFDGWQYHQPTVTREGDCRIDTSRLDQEAEELPGYGSWDSWG